MAVGEEETGGQGETGATGSGRGSEDVRRAIIGRNAILVDVGVELKAASATVVSHRPGAPTPPEMASQVVVRKALGQIRPREHRLCESSTRSGKSDERSVDGVETEGGQGRVQ